MKYLSVCSGIEAATSAWHHLGWEPVAFSEIEPFPSAVLQHHYPSVPNWGDMTKYQTWPDATIDLLVGGTPCQSFSIAGLRKGLEDPRGNLMLTFLGIAQRYRPKYIVWENVPGVLSSNGGRDFGTFLAALGELGYGWAYRVLDAQWFGVAQRRRRVFVVGCLGDQRRAAQVLFECESVRRDTPPSRAKGQGAAADAQGGVDERGLQTTVGTLCADTHPGAYSGQDAYSGRLVPHAFKVRGGCEGGGKGYLGSDDTAFTVATHQDQHIAQPVNIYGGNKRSDRPEGGFYVKAEETSKTLDAASGLNPTCSQGGTAIIQPVAFTVATHQDQQIAQPVAFAQNTRDEVRLQNGDGQIAGALAAEPGMNQTTYVAQPVALASRDVCPTLNTVSQRFNHDHESTAYAIPAMQVRRLTPVECERLQGFSDNHTNIPWRGKAEAPDGPRYKALGNSMAVPVMRWIGERINRP